MLLEALEDASRSSLGEGMMCPKGLTVEHVMPRAWEHHWGADIVSDIAAALRRNQLVHTLGNLTLVSGRLNPTLSNRPWRDAEAGARGLGAEGKRSYLLAHSELKLNSRLVATHPDRWTEQNIRERTSELTELILTIWPCPTNATQPAGSHHEAREASLTLEPNEVAGKYSPLSRWLAEQELEEIRLSFEEIEKILGASLPASVSHERHWRSYSGSAVTRAIQDAGWRATEVDVAQRRVVLTRLTGDDDPELQPWGEGDNDAEAARFVWEQLPESARRLVSVLVRTSPEAIASTELADAIGVAGPLGVAGVLTRPGALCRGIGKQWVVEWVPGHEGQASQYWINEATAAVFRPLAAGWETAS
jgi:hypothetical protein